MAQEPDTAQLFELFNEIGIINQLASNRFERALPEGLTTAQFSVLNHFVRLGGERSPKRLAGAFQVTKGAMTNTLSKLEKKGLIRVVPDPTDGRAKVVSITPEGVALRHRAIAEATRAMADLQSVVSSEQAQAMLPALREIRAYLDEHRDSRA